MGIESTEDAKSYVHFLKFTINLWFNHSIFSIHMHFNANKEILYTLGTGSGMMRQSFFQVMFIYLCWPHIIRSLLTILVLYLWNGYVWWVGWPTERDGLGATAKCKSDKMLEGTKSILALHVS